MSPKAALMPVIAACLLAAPFAYAGDAKDGHTHSHGEHAMKMDMTAVSVGDLLLAGAFSRATLPNQPVAGAFLQITNNGDTDDRLIAVFASFAERGEIHEMAMQDDVMRMRKLDDGLLIPAGETVALQPGGYHLMFMKLKAPLVEGDKIEAVLEFENAGAVAVTFNVLGKGAKTMDHSGHGS